MASTLIPPSPLPAFCRPLTPSPIRNTHFTLRPQPRSLAVVFAAANSGASKPLAAANTDAEPPLGPLLLDLADSLQLPPDYLARLPSDLRLDLNDAAFDLSSGPVLDECGQDLGQLLLNLSRAWEQADTSTSNSIANQIPLMQKSLTDNVKSAFGKRLVSAGRRFAVMGPYGEGELEKIANAMMNTGKLFSASPVIEVDETPKKESRTLKFGNLQIELTPEKANIGAVVAVAFGILCWQLSQGIQGMPENSQYANDNALQLAKSLRGALLVICYSSSILSLGSSVGLLLLGRQLSSDSKLKNLE